VHARHLDGGEAPLARLLEAFRIGYQNDLPTPSISAMGPCFISPLA
jgi:hypothetical protein